MAGDAPGQPAHRGLELFVSMDGRKEGYTHPCKQPSASSHAQVLSTIAIPWPISGPCSTANWTRARSSLPSGVPHLLGVGWQEQVHCPQHQTRQMSCSKTLLNIFYPAPEIVKGVDKGLRQSTLVKL